MLGYNSLQVIELIGNVASFRGFWNVLDVYFIPGNYSYQVYSILNNTLQEYILITISEFMFVCLSISVWVC